MTRNLTYSSLFVLALLAFSAQAEIYKWTDANGKTQYSDTQPGSAKANVVKTAPAPATAGSGASWEEKDREFRARKARQSASGPREEDPQRNSQRLCADARMRLENFNGKMIYRTGKNGERVFVEDSERASIEKSARETIAQHCPR